MPILRTGFTIWTIGAGLKLLFNEHTHVAVYVVVLAVEGAGIGWVHQPGMSTAFFYPGPAISPID
jgi:hypothetical protein